MRILAPSVHSKTSLMLVISRWDSLEPQVAAKGPRGLGGQEAEELGSQEGL